MNKYEGHEQGMDDALAAEEILLRREEQRFMEGISREQASYGTIGRHISLEPW